MRADSFKRLLGGQFLSETVKVSFLRWLRVLGRVGAVEVHKLEFCILGPLICPIVVLNRRYEPVVHEQDGMARILRSTKSESHIVQVDARRSNRGSCARYVQLSGAPDRAPVTLLNRHDLFLSAKLLQHSVLAREQRI